jgi:basic amino acid/polyamine antiporter, APA family
LNTSTDSIRRIGLLAATAIVIANMIGTGVFTSLGFQLLGITSPFAIIMLWLVGGVVALCGALVYGELAVTFPRSGGEYNFLSKTYHPLVGFLSGWLSVTVGFAAPVALAAMAFGQYSGEIFPGMSQKDAAIGIVLFMAIVHGLSVSYGSNLQTFFTLLKIALIVFLIGCGLMIPHPQSISFLADTAGWKATFSGAFAVSLVYVSYAYSGWNASAYIAGEIKQPMKNLPRSLFVGTAIVTLLYVGLNFVFLYVAPINEMKVIFTDKGPTNIDTGYVAARYIFSTNGALIMAAFISLALVSSVSAMTMAGPRVTKTIGEDFPVFKKVTTINAGGAPYIAIILQAAISLLLILTGSFQSVLTYIGFTLSLSTCLTVFGIFIIRKRKLTPANEYHCWGYPITPILFLALNIWMLIYLMHDNPKASLGGFVTLAVGIPFYFIGHKKQLKTT